MQARGKGRPRLDPRLRPRIVQLRAANPAHPLSLDAILDELSKEKWARLPSRGTVQNVVAAWEKSAPEIRERDLPFEWSQLDRARIPWESSSWVLACFHGYQLQQAEAARVWESQGAGDRIANLISITQPFTNRWAAWCWRVHQAAPDLTDHITLMIAAEFSLAEQSKDLEKMFGRFSMLDTSGLDDFLRWQPWRGWHWLDHYEEGLRLGLAQALPPEPYFDNESQIEFPLAFLVASLGWRDWWEGRRSEILQEEISKNTETSAKEEGVNNGK